jgi:hypothetical protein
LINLNRANGPRSRKSGVSNKKEPPEGGSKSQLGKAPVAFRMPKATAVWLVEQHRARPSTRSPSFCKLHPLEVKGIADGEVAQGIKGLDPITSGQLTREEIARARPIPNHR